MAFSQVASLKLVLSSHFEIFLKVALSKKVCDKSVLFRIAPSITASSKLAPC